MIKILLADDHKIMREGIKSLLEKYSDLQIVGEAENGLDIVKLAKEHIPDVIVMDISMPNLSGIEASRQIIGENPGIKIIILTMHTDRRFIAEVIKAGCMGYLIKDCAFDELVNAIHSVIDGKMYISHSLSGIMVKEYIDRIYSEEVDVLSRLTEKEKVVLKQIAEGKNVKEIAAEHGLSIKTVETHRNNIMKKLDLSSVTELVKFAIKEGIIDL